MTEPTLQRHTEQVRLDKFSATGFDRGASRLKEILWVGIGAPVLKSFVPGSCWRAILLRSFGASIGRRTVWKTGVRVKFPWRLIIGHNCWIGEEAWIDNLAQVTLEDHTCISQGAYLCTGNHDWSLETFDLVVQDIYVETGAWIGAKSIVCPGTRIQKGAIVTAGSVANGTLDCYTIYRGNRAAAIGRRLFRPAELN
jgi:putative colanic acid biosynthesis acetyltransferase WcaF